MSLRYRQRYERPGFSRDALPPNVSTMKVMMRAETMASMLPSITFWLKGQKP